MIHVKMKRKSDCGKDLAGGKGIWRLGMDQGRKFGFCEYVKRKSLTGDFPSEAFLNDL